MASGPKVRSGVPAAEALPGGGCPHHGRRGGRGGYTRIVRRGHSIRIDLLLSALLLASGCKTAPPPQAPPPAPAQSPTPTPPAPTRTPVSEKEKQRRRTESEAQKREQHQKLLATVNVTSNPDVVRPCQNLKAFDETEQAERTRDDRSALDALKQDVLSAGGNTLLLAPDGLRGDAYLCPAKP